MKLLMILIATVLFIILSPGLLCKSPVKGSLLKITLVHSLVFLVVYYCASQIFDPVRKELFGNPAPTCSARSVFTNSVCYNDKTKQRSPIICAPGTTFNPAVGTCNPNPPDGAPGSAPTCSTGFTFNNKKRKCMSPDNKKSEPVICPDGTIYNPDTLTCLPD